MKLSLPPQLLGKPAPELEPVPAAQPEPHSSAPAAEPGSDLATDDLPPVLDEMIQSQPEIQPTPPPPPPPPPDPAPPAPSPAKKPPTRLALAGLVGLAALGLSLTIALATTGRKPAPGGVHVPIPSTHQSAHQPARNSGYWE